MDVQGSSAEGVDLDASGRCESETAAAAPVDAIDYEPIIEDAVADLVHNTSDRRGKVYAHARSVVIGQLQLMQLPEPVIELEKLALDLAIAKIERRWRARTAADETGGPQNAFPANHLKRTIDGPITAGSAPRRRL